MLCVSSGFPLTAKGFIHLCSHCRGSGSPPRQTNQDVSGDQATLDVQSDPPRAPQNQPLHLESVPKVRVLKNIPKAAREQYGLKLGEILDGIVINNTPQSWESLFFFSVLQ